MPTIIGIDFDFFIIYQIKHFNKAVNIPYIYSFAVFHGFLGIMSKETDLFQKIGHYHYLFIVKSKGRNIICISSATFFRIINNSYDGGSKCVISLMSFKKYYLSYNKMGIICGMDGCS